MAARRIISVGECMIEFSPADGIRYSLGFAGDTFNTAWYLRRLLGEEWVVQYLTNVGDDRLSADMLRFMRESGIDTNHVRTISGRSCGLYVISLDDGERSFSYWRSASAARTLADDAGRLTVALDGAGCAIFSGITLAILPESGRQTLLECMGNLRRSGTIVAFDSNVRKRLWANEGDSRHWITRAYETANIALPSWSDEAELFGDRDTFATAKRISSAGVEEVVVKNGAGAFLVRTRDVCQSLLPHTNVTIVDTTGAGDSFNAGYLAARLQGESPEIAVLRAQSVATKVIAGRGALVSL
jgi:2-dehydro-3-deoxygluconokinase